MGNKQVIDWKTPKDIVYGEALGDKQLNAELEQGNGKLAYKPAKGFKPEVGKCVLTVTAGKTKEFDESSASVTLNVKKAAQVIDWKNPAAITFGEALGPKQLDATLKEGDGELSYAPKAKAVLDAGKHTLKVTAAATKNFEAASAEVTLVVDKAKPVIEWKTPKPIAYGEALGASELNAVLKEGDGKLVYERKAGDRPPCGGPQTLRVNVAATKNYEAGEATVTLVVLPVPQVIDAVLPATFDYGQSFVVLKEFKGTLVSGKPVIAPALYEKDFATLKPGDHKFTLKLAASASLLPFEREFAFTVLEPPPIAVATWMAKLGFAAAGNLYLKQLKVFNGAGAGLTGKGKALHLSIFKSQLPGAEGVPGRSTAQQVLDILFPADGAQGFHITLEWQQGETSLKNPHVYRGLATIYKGQGVTYSKEEWTALEKKLGNLLNAEVVKLKAAITGTGWCQG
jgi:hypothetical protein